MDVIYPPPRSWGAGEWKIGVFGKKINPQFSTISSTNLY